MNDIGARIRARRERLGWTIQKVATIAGITASFLSRLERGKTYYSLETIQKIAGALGVSYEVFFISNSNVEDAPKDWREIPVLDYREAAKWDINSVATQLGSHETIMTHLEHSPSTFALRIRGKSMEPKFQEGDVIVADPTLQPIPGDFVVGTQGKGEVVFAQYRSGGLNEKGEEVFELWPLNKIFAPMKSDRQPLGIVGVMVEHRSFRRR
jgi:transcriptional regulator with XRE-family HTH domain